MSASNGGEAPTVEDEGGAAHHEDASLPEGRSSVASVVAAPAETEEGDEASPERAAADTADARTTSPRRSLTGAAGGRPATARQLIASLPGMGRAFGGDAPPSQGAAAPPLLTDDNGPKERRAIVRVSRSARFAGASRRVC